MGPAINSRARYIFESLPKIRPIFAAVFLIYPKIEQSLQTNSILVKISTVREID